VIFTLTSMDNEIGRSVLVVGASRGIGAAIAQTFADVGDRVAATHRGSGVPLEKVVAVQMDVTDDASVERALAEVTEAQGAPEIVVYNAGITRDTLLLRMSEDDYRDVVETNQVGAFRVLRRAVKPMLRSRRGSIVLVSSASARAGAPGQVNYSSSKAALEGLARSTAKEYAAKGIRVNVVAPGPTDTDMVAAMTDTAREQLISEVPLGRLARPDEIASVVSWVADATFVTGATIPVTGGAAMGY
jgi:3-oxoacyl-[acyl-carrier protein] reductase